MGLSSWEGLCYVLLVVVAVAVVDQFANWGASWFGENLVARTGS